jgi:hypothetical protein
MEQLKKVLDFLKDYLAIFLVVPTVLGGIWQIVMLGSISLTFIRFFSLSQIIQDGLLMIILIIVLSFISLIFVAEFFILHGIGRSLEGIKSVRYLHIWLYRLNQYSWKAAALIFPIMIIPGIALYIYLVQVNQGNILPKFQQSLPFFLVAGALVTGYFYLLNYLLTWANKDLRNFLQGGVFSASVVGLFVILQTFSFINKEYLLPHNLVNLKKIEKLVLRENPGEEVNLIYMNDKFIFLEISKNESSENKNESNNKMVILKFDDLLQ